MKQTRRQFLQGAMKAIGGLALASMPLSFLNSCAKPTMPTNPSLVPRKVVCSKPVFANCDAKYDVTVQNQTKPCSVTYKTGNYPSWLYADDISDTVKRIRIPSDDCSGSLEFKVFEAGEETPTESDMVCYKGDAVTNAELKTYLDSIVVPASIDPKQIKAVQYDVDIEGGSYLPVDAQCTRGNNAIFYVVRVSSNSEIDNKENYDMYHMADILFIEPTQNQETIIQNYLNQF